jgi:intracellular sulfur oxidation DsrE/DsrF family protein
VNTRWWKIGLTGLFGLLALAGAVYATPGDALQRVVYHIDDGDPERQRAALRIVNNHLNDMGDDSLDIRVVVQGNGVTMLVMPNGADGQQVPGNATDRVKVQIEDLKIRGVTFAVCGNSLKRRDIHDANRLFDVAPDDIVDSGVGELVRLQGDGYTYIKP